MPTGVLNGYLYSFNTCFANGAISNDPGTENLLNSKTGFFLSKIDNAAFSIEEM